MPAAQLRAMHAHASRPADFPLPVFRGCIITT